MINIKNLYTNIIFTADTKLCDDFSNVIDQINNMKLMCNTKLMYHINDALFDNKKILAQRLYQHSLYESIGGKLIQDFAEKNAKGKLKEDIMLQVKDEYRHGQMFASLIQFTGYDTEEIKSSIGQKDFENEEFPIFENVIDGICFVHIAEIRTILLLDQFCKIIENKNEPKLSKMLPILNSINKDEIKHARYTGVYINDWMKGNNEVAKAFIGCCVQINKEAWEEIGKLADMFAQSIQSTY